MTTTRMRGSSALSRSSLSSAVLSLSKQPAEPVEARNPAHRSATAHRRSGRLSVAGLILLSLIPVLGGVFRLTDLTGGAITADNARFFASPIPVIAHIVGATVYCLLGAFQFLPALRSRRRWHRVAGLILIPAGLIAALSGLWMAAFYTSLDGGNPLLMIFRLAFGTAMGASIILGIAAIRRRDLASHGAWMTRAYSLGIAAGTQAVVLAIWILSVGPVDGLTEAVLMAAAWLINAGIAELVIRRRAQLKRVELVETSRVRRGRYRDLDKLDGSLRQAQYNARQARPASAP